MTFSSCVSNMISSKKKNEHKVKAMSDDKEVLCQKYRTRTNIIFFVVLAAILAIAISMFGSKLSNPSIWQFRESDPEAMKSARVRERGSMTSLASSMTMGVLVATLDFSCDINMFISSIFFSLILGNVVGFILDSSFASDEGRSLVNPELSSDPSQWNIHKAVRYGFAQLSTRNFGRYMITVLLDVFISSVLIDESLKMLQGIRYSSEGSGAAANLRRFLYVATNCGRMEKLVPTLTTTLVSVITFYLYTNDTRFSWAFRANKFPDTATEWALNPNVQTSDIEEIALLRSYILDGNNGNVQVGNSPSMSRYGSKWRQFGPVRVPNSAAGSDSKADKTLAGPVPKGTRIIDPRIVDSVKVAFGSSLSKVAEIESVGDVQYVASIVKPHDYLIIDGIYYVPDLYDYSAFGPDMTKDKFFRLDESLCEHASLFNFLRSSMHAKKSDCTSMYEGSDSKTIRYRIRELMRTVAGYSFDYKTTNFIMASTIAGAFYLYKPMQESSDAWVVLDKTPTGSSVVTVSDSQVVERIRRKEPLTSAELNTLKITPSTTVSAAGRLYKLAPTAFVSQLTLKRILFSAFALLTVGMMMTGNLGMPSSFEYGPNREGVEKSWFTGYLMFMLVTIFCIAVVFSTQKRGTLGRMSKFAIAVALAAIWLLPPLMVAMSPSANIWTLLASVGGLLAVFAIVQIAIFNGGIPSRFKKGPSASNDSTVRRASSEEMSSASSPAASKASSTLSSKVASPIASKIASKTALASNAITQMKKAVTSKVMKPKSASPTPSESTTK